MQNVKYLESPNYFSFSSGMMNFVDDTSVDDRLSLIEAELDEIDISGRSPVSRSYIASVENQNHSRVMRNTIPDHVAGSTSLSPEFRGGRIPRGSIESLHSVYSVPDVTRGLDVLSLRSSNSSVLGRRELRRERDDERHLRISLQLKAEKYQRELGRLEGEAIENFKLSRAERARLEQDISRVKRALVEVEENWKDSSKLAKKIDEENEFLSADLRRAQELVVNRDRDIDLLTASVKDLEKKRSMAVSHSEQLQEEKQRIEQELTWLKDQFRHDHRREASREVSHEVQYVNNMRSVSSGVQTQEIKHHDQGKAYSGDRAQELVVNRDRDIDLLTASLKDVESKRAMAVSNSDQLQEEKQRIEQELNWLKDQCNHHHRREASREVSRAVEYDYNMRNVSSGVQTREINHQDKETTISDAVTVPLKTRKEKPPFLPIKEEDSLRPTKGFVTGKGDENAVPMTVGNPGSTARRISSAFEEEKPPSRSPIAFTPPVPIIPKDQSVLFATHSAVGSPRSLVSVVDPHRYRPPLIKQDVLSPNDQKRKNLQSIIGDHTNISPIGALEIIDPQHHIPVTQTPVPTAKPCDQSMLLGNHTGVIPLGEILTVDPQHKDASKKMIKSSNSSSWSLQKDIISIEPPPLDVAVEKKDTIQSSSAVKKGFRKASKAVFPMGEENERNEVPLPSAQIDEETVSQLEGFLLKLNLEREQLQAWLGRLPAYSAGRTLEERKEKFLKEKRLEDVEKAKSEVVQKLKAIKHRRSNPMDSSFP